jgi:hypothetical protein
MANHDDYWLGRLTVSVTRSRCKSNQQASSTREPGPKKEHGAEAPCSLHPLSGRWPADPAPANRQD